MTLGAPDNSDDIIPELTWRTYILPMIKMTQIGLFPPIFNNVIDVRAEIYYCQIMNLLHANQLTHLGWNIK